MIKEAPVAKKHLGQNFLRNQHILNTIIHAESLSGKNILEIGPGPGDLTDALLSKNPDSLRVIEIDSDMISLLQKRFGENIDIYHNDVLKINISQSVSKDPSVICIPYPYSVYGNIPYYITSPILYHFLYEVEHLPDSLTITMQKEVAERILARDQKHSVLSIGCQLMADIQKICDIHPHNFTPIPKVWSTCLSFKIQSGTNRILQKKIFTLVKQGFTQKRKKLLSNLMHAGYSQEDLKKIFSLMGIQQNVRAEELSVQNWITLSQNILS